MVLAKARSCIAVRRGLRPIFLVMADDAGGCAAAKRKKLLETVKVRGTSLPRRRLAQGENRAEKKGESGKQAKSHRSGATHGARHAYSFRCPAGTSLSPSTHVTEDKGPARGGLVRKNLRQENFART